jgi:hypothetical protein
MSKARHIVMAAIAGTHALAAPALALSGAEHPLFSVIYDRS